MTGKIKVKWSEGIINRRHYETEISKEEYGQIVREHDIIDLFIQIAPVCIVVGAIQEGMRRVKGYLCTN